jgi:hypothetical protein
LGRGLRQVVSEQVRQPPSRLREVVSSTTAKHHISYLDISHYPFHTMAYPNIVAFIEKIHKSQELLLQRMDNNNQ